MADPIIKGKKIKDLPLASTLNDTDDVVLEDTPAAGVKATPKRFRLSTLAAWLSNKLIVNSLVTTVAGKALDAMQGKILSDRIAALNADLGKTNTALTGSLGNCKFIDTGYVRDSVNILIPEGTTAIVIVAGALYLVRSLSTNMLKDLIGGTESASYVIRTAPSSRRFYADAATAGNTCRISAILFKD